MLKYLFNESGKGGSQTTVVTTPEPTEQEKALEEQELEIRKLQLEETKRQNKLMAELAPSYEELTRLQLEQTTGQAELLKSIGPGIEELNRLSLEEARRQSDLISKYGAGFEDLYQMNLEQALQEGRLAQEFAPQQHDLARQEMELAQQRADLTQQYAGSLQEYLAAQGQASYDTTEMDRLNQELEGALLERQLAYAGGEMPQLTPQQQAQLAEYTDLQKELVFEDIEQQKKLGLQGARNQALGRGVFYSSIRSSLEDEIRKKSMQQAGEAERRIEGDAFNYAWNLPLQRQGYETEMSEYQQSLNQQAEANRARLSSSLASSPSYGYAGGLASVSPQMPQTGGVALPNFQGVQWPSMNMNTMPTSGTFAGGNVVNTTVDPTQNQMYNLGLLQAGLGLGSAFGNALRY